LLYTLNTLSKQLLKFDKSPPSGDVCRGVGRNNNEAEKGKKGAVYPNPRWQKVNNRCRKVETMRTVGRQLIRRIPLQGKQDGKDEGQKVD